MKQPKLSELAIDRAGTKRLRGQLKKTKRIKITINFDATSLGVPRKKGGKTSRSYDHILSQLFKNSLNETAIARLDRIEREVEKLKRQFAA
jgi:hypothetical protein